MKGWLHNLRASFAAFTDSVARDTRLRLYGDPKTIEELGIAAAKAGLSPDDVEPAARAYYRAQAWGLIGYSPGDVARQADTLRKVRAAHTEYRRSGDLHELARTMNTLLGVKP